MQRTNRNLGNDKSRWKPAVITNQHYQPTSYTIQTQYENKNAKHLTRTSENVSLDNEMTFEHSNGDTNISKEYQSKNYTQPEVAELLEH